MALPGNPLQGSLQKLALKLAQQTGSVPPQVHSLLAQQGLETDPAKMPAVLAQYEAQKNDITGIDFIDKGLNAIGQALPVVGPIALTLGGLGAAGVGPLAAGGSLSSASLAGGAAESAAAGGATAAEGAALGSGITPGVGGGTLGTGITPGTTATGIGGGAAGTGITGTAAGTSLAPAFFAGETLAPGAAGGGASFGGTTGTGGGNALAPSGGVAGGTLANIALGIPGLLGAVASGQQADAYKDLAKDYMAVGAPARARFEASYAPGFSMEEDPGFKDALDQAAKATLHGLSVGGNPAGSPNAWAQSLTDLYQKHAHAALQNYRNQNAAAGGMGALTAAAPGTSNSAIAAQGNVFNSIGAAANDIFNPPKSLTQLLREIRAA